MKASFISILFGMLYFTYSALAQDTSSTPPPPQHLVKLLNATHVKKDIPAQISTVYDIGVYYEDLGLFDEAERYYTNALELSNNNNYTKDIGKILNGFSVLERYRGNYDKSMEFAMKARKADAKLGDVLGEAKSTYNVSIALFSIGDYEKAMSYASISTSLYNQKDDKQGFVKTSIVKSMCLSEIGNYEEAISELDESLNYALETQDSTLIAALYSNLSYIANLARDFQASLKYNKMALLFASFTSKSNPLEKHIVLSNISLDFMHIELYDSALVYSDLVLKDLEKTKSKLPLRDAYYRRAQILQGLETFEQAFEFLNKYVELDDEIFNEDKVKAIQEVEAKYKVEVKEKNLALQKKQVVLLKTAAENDRLKIGALTIGGVLLLSAVFAIYFAQKRKREAERLAYENEQQHAIAKKQLLQLELDKKSLSNEQLSAEVNYKNQELKNLAYHIVQRNEALEDLKKQLKSGSIVNVKTLIQHINIGMDSSKEEFEQKVDHINLLFHKNLLTKYPELTSSDLRLLSLLKANTSSKDISVLLHITPKSVDMARYRLRKKMDLSSGTNFSDYLQQY
jgi:tetratricopeptide (TPR) repeat protein